jgi:type IX secretion system PorP/SprF family membrane protein
MKIYKYIICLFLIFNLLRIYGQDPHYSNYSNNYLFFNPAYTGIDYGLRSNLAYRRQWPGIPSMFQTFYTSLEQSIRAFKGAGGFGILISSNTEGVGSLKITTISIPLAVRIPVANYSIIQMGVMPSFNFIQISWDNFIFSGQLNPYYGKIYNSSFQPPNSDVSKKAYADIFNVGLVFRYDNRSGQANSLSFYRRFEIGIAGFHLSEPNQSFTGAKAPLPAKFTLFSNYTHSFSLGNDGYLFLQPSILLEKQWRMFSYILGTNIYFTDYNINLGIYWRNGNVDFKRSDAIIVLFGYKFFLNSQGYNYLTTSFSYDITLSGLKDFSGGAPEITLNIVFGKHAIFKDRPDMCDEGSVWMNQKKKRIRRY